MGGLALDTSVIVAGLQSWHVHHEPTSAFLLHALASEEDVVIPLPALVEAYSVMTRLPRPRRLRPATALEPQAVLSTVVLVAALAAGGAWVHLEPPGAASGIREGVGTGVVDFPPERVFRAVADLEHWEEWVPFLVEADARRRPDGTVESRQRLEAPALGRPLVYTVRARAEIAGEGRARRWTLTWSHVPGSGNVAGHRGSWTLAEHSPGRTLATCRLFTDPGGDTPAWAMNRATRKMIGWMFDSLPLQTNRGRYQPTSR